MKILSLFDGMACGALAMQAAGIEIDKYIAYEVDKYAIQTAQHNFPFIEERGDVFKADFTEHVGFDYLIGGSPCTYWSIAQTKNRETVASGMGWELFSQYVRALHEAKPRFFFYENNKSMSAAIRASITETFGFEPILINSALVSAQNRQRLYWCGIRQADGTYKKADIQQPADRGILLKDILETNAVTWQEKAYTYTTRCQGAVIENTLEKHQHTMVAEPVCVAQRGRYDESGKVFQHYEAQPTGKTNNLTTVSKDNLIAEPVKLGEIGKGGQGNRVYSIYGKAVAQTAQSGGMGGNTGLYAEPVNVMQYELQSVENKDAGVVGILDMAGQEQIKRVYGTNGKCATLTTCQGGHREPKVFERIAEPVQPLTEKEMDYMIRDHQDQRWSFCNKPGQEDKSKCLVANVHKGVPYNILAEPVNITKDGKAGTLRATYYKDGVRNLIANSIDKKTCVAMRVNEATKAAPIYEVKDGYITVKGNKYPIKLVDGFYIIRKLTVRECMRLQTVPEWYEWPVSKSQAYKMLGNGWTVEVIAHLLRGLK